MELRYFHELNAQVLAVSDARLDDDSCVILFGEPGSGKTDAFANDLGMCQQRLKAGGATIITRELRAYGSEDHLIRDIFETPEIISWKAGTNQLVFFLDGLDECRLQIKQVGSLLGAQFKKCPVDRLRLRITCRSGDWPKTLDDALDQVFSGKVVRRLVLAPLQQKDIILAAKAESVDVDEFLKRIYDRDAQAWARKPLTLKFLIAYFKDKGDLPVTSHELYEAGCLVLCGESNDHRKEVSKCPSAWNRLAVAKRLAAISIFCNMEALQIAPDSICLENCIEFGDILGGSEPSREGDIEITESAVTDVFKSGLFETVSNVATWSHRSYAEFLAAMYLKDRKLTLNQLSKLTKLPGDDKVIPQLRQTAGRLAAMDREFRQKLIEGSPEALLASDISFLSDSERFELTAVVLSAGEAGDVKWSDFGLIGLAHSNLHEQLRQIIQDSSRKEIVRHLVIAIARACTEKRLAPELISLALNSKELYELRVDAINALEKCGDDSTWSQLKPLLQDPADADDEMKGHILSALWPNTMKWNELEPHIVSSVSDSFYGRYWSFLAKIGENIPLADLQAALRWVATRGPIEQVGGLRVSVEGILRRAWHERATPGILKELAAAIMSRLVHDHELKLYVSDTPLAGGTKRSVWNDDNIRRKSLVSELAQAASTIEWGHGKVFYRLSGIILWDDLPWMLEKLKADSDGATRRVWAEWIKPYLIGTLRESTTSDLAKLALNVCDSSSELAEVMKCYLSLSDDGSARQWRIPELPKDDDMNAAVSEITDRDIVGRIRHLLNSFEAGDLSAWWRINYELAINLQKNSLDESEPDLTKSPLWPSESENRNRLLSAARIYIQQHQPAYSRWLGKNVNFRPDFAAYRALVLIHKLYPEELNQSNNIWKRWGRVTMAIPDDTTCDRIETQRTLVKMAYRAVPDDIISALMVKLGNESQCEHVSVLMLLKECFDQKLGTALLWSLKGLALLSPCRGTVLKFLIKNEFLPAIDLARALQTLPLPCEEGERDYAATAAASLLCYAVDIGWTDVWLAFQSDEEFAFNSIGKLATIHDETNGVRCLATRVAPQGLADLFLFITRKYPIERTMPYRGLQFHGIDHDIKELRDNLLRVLERLGTEESCNAIERLVRELPQVEWLVYTLSQAREITRRQAWQPLSPTQFLRATFNREKRIVCSGEELLDVLIESLNEYQEELFGKLTPVFELWNESQIDETKKKKNIHIPKDEARLSQALERHLCRSLRDEGIIANREVEIRPAVGNAPGEETDIKIDVFVKGPNGEKANVISAIIEVKGCWNKEVNTAMETQLKDRYLTNNKSTFGIYVVGWYHCDAWSDTDYRKGRTPDVSFDVAQKMFADQAEKLSNDSFDIRSVTLDIRLSKNKK